MARKPAAKAAAALPKAPQSRRKPGKVENLTAPRFEPGASGNPGGKTKEQRRLEIENAHKVTRLRAAHLDRMIAKLEEVERLHLLPDGTPDPSAYAALGELNGDLLRFFKDTEDRGLGAPVQHTEVKQVAELPDDVLDREIAEMERALRPPTLQ